jgi:hypothetical protein
MREDQPSQNQVGAGGRVRERGCAQDKTYIFGSECHNLSGLKLIPGRIHLVNYARIMQE